jgi:hypothetical protein
MRSAGSVLQKDSRRRCYLVATPHVFEEKNKRLIIGGSGLILLVVGAAEQSVLYQLYAALVVPRGFLGGG